MPGATGSRFALGVLRCAAAARAHWGAHPLGGCSGSVFFERAGRQARPLAADHLADAADVTRPDFGAMMRRQSGITTSVGITPCTILAHLAPDSLQINGREAAQEKEDASMNVEQLLKDTANTYMTATLAKRVTGDVVRKVPLSSLGTIVLASAMAGFWLARYNRARSRLTP